MRVNTVDSYTVLLVLLKIGQFSEICDVKNTVEYQYNEILGTSEINLL